MNDKRISLKPLMAALMLSLGLVATSQAMPRGERHGVGMNAPGHHAMFQGRAMARLHDELKLDDRQESLWKAADKAAQEQRTTMREKMSQHHAEIKRMLDQPGADLRAVAKRMDDLKAESMKQRDAVRENWLAFYDSLNGEQKEKARLFFKAGMERAERMGQRAKDHRGRGQAVREQPVNPAPKN